MHFNNEAIKELRKPANVDARAAADYDKIEADIREFVATTRSQLDDELQRIALAAQSCADMFWAGKESAVDDRKPEEQTFVGTRARIHSNTLEAVWYRNQVIQPKDGGKKRVFSRHIPKGVGLQYSPAKFKREPEWAQGVIAMVEERYVVLRKRARAITRMRKALLEYEALLEENPDV